MTIWGQIGAIAAALIWCDLAALPSGQKSGAG